MTVMSFPVLHIHPTRMCNLACAHCYSTSGPSQRGHLAAGEILAASGRLFGHGYRQASLSGGEPLLYPDRQALAAGLKDQGYKVSVITNGWFPERVLPLCEAGHVDQVSISFDGLPCVHDLVRRRSGAFDKAIEALRALRDADVLTGAVIAVTRASLPQLPDLVALLVQERVCQLQFHPVAEVGRASGDADCAELTEEQLLRVLLLTRAFGEMYPHLPFSTDALTGQDIASARLGTEGDLISPLVIEETGRVTPVAYGFDRRQSLGSLQEGFADPFVTPALSQVIHAAQSRCGGKLASAFFPELVEQSKRAA